MRQDLKITVDQIKTIHILKSKLKISHSEYESILSGYKVETSKDLLLWQASELIRNLSDKVSKMGFAYVKAKGKRGRERHLTPEQLSRIEVLQKLLGWDSLQLTGFLERQVKRLTDVSMIMNFEATKVIIGMQRVLSDKISSKTKQNKNEIYSSINDLTITGLKALLKASSK